MTRALCCLQGPETCSSLWLSELHPELHLASILCAAHRDTALCDCHVVWWHPALFPVSRHLDPSQVFLGSTVMMTLACVSSTQVEQFLFCVCSGRLVGLSVALTVMALWKQLMMRAPQVIQSWSYPTVDGCWPTVWQVRSLWSVWEVVHTSVWSCLHFFGSSRLNIFPHCYSPLPLWNACSHPGWPWSQGWT